jgi:integrase
MKLVKPLTDYYIKNIKPKDKPLKSFDGKGLYLETLPTGRKSWRLKYRERGQEKRKTIGNWPEISLRQARDLTLSFRQKLYNGESTDDKATVKSLCLSWLKNKENNVTTGEMKKRQRFFDEIIFPAIGGRKIDSLNAKELLENIFRPIEAKGQYYTAHRIKGIMTQVYSYGIATGAAKRNVFHDIQGALAPKLKPIPRASIHDKTTIGNLLLKMEQYQEKPMVMLALRMLAYVFVRPSELRTATWGEIDLNDRLWRIPAEKMKRRKPHLVPLSTQVIEILDKLKKLNEDSIYLFPQETNKDKPIATDYFNRGLRSLGYGKDDICAHGFRSMSSTLLNELGFNKDWIERQLAHIDGNAVRASYNFADYMPERRAMMQQWADYLDQLKENAYKDYPYK